MIVKIGKLAIFADLESMGREQAECGFSLQVADKSHEEKKEEGSKKIEQKSGSRRNFNHDRCE